VKFYACKTIENITAQSINAGTKFANMDSVNSMIQIISTTRNENLKVCAIICLNHIGRLNPSLVSTILEKYTLKQACSNFTESHPRIQQVLFIYLFPKAKCYYRYLLLLLVSTYTQTRIKPMLSSQKKRLLFLH